MQPPSPARTTDSAMLGRLLQGASLGRSSATLATKRKGTSYARGMHIFGPRVPQQAVIRAEEERERACNVSAPELTRRRRLEIERWCEGVAAASDARDRAASSSRH